jgi:hypothetical protein
VIGEDPTLSDAPRLVVGSPVSNAVAQAAAGRSSKAVAVYVPITVHFSLLASIRGIAVPAPPEKSARDPLADLLAMEKQPLSVGAPELVSRLVYSTVWASKQAGDGIWACAKHPESRQNCLLYEAEAHMEAARAHCRAHNLVSAYEQLGAASVIGSDYARAHQQRGAGGALASPWGRSFEVLPAMMRMRCSLAGKSCTLVNAISDLP